MPEVLRDWSTPGVVTYEWLQHTGGGFPSCNQSSVISNILNFRTPKKFCLNLPRTQTKRPNLRVFRQKDVNGTANSEDPDQTAPLGAV